MDALWIVLALLAGGLLGWPVTAGILWLARSADAQEQSRNQPGDDGPEPADQPQDLVVADAAAESAAASAAAIQPSTGLPAGVLRGGLVIGFLERLAVVVCILTDQPVAIAYVVAIKGLGRYPELKDTPAASERFIIGTLASMLWAAAVAVLAKWLLLA
ncbi:hypothetical protein [Arthrobacter sp. 35W]|uniref:hypothetical protein n=1 Tax=Arthrobacter sp. 35W TaxID=1132441 RepID=UPI00040F5F48|nr:hypothetical protein [Arthrobacter sp. 35W]